MSKPKRMQQRASTKTDTNAPVASNTADSDADIGSFPIVGIGASAGGLDASRRLLATLPADTGMAFVLIQHLSPDHPSHLAEILSRSTAMPVIEVQDEPTVEPNHVYVIPPGRDMVIGKRSLQLHPRAEPARSRRPIDSFLRSLAEDQAHCAIGVVLSGTGNDGSVGIEEIKAQGGITFAQDESAQHDSMPRSAIGSGCIDFVMSPEQIAAELTRIGQHPYVVATADALPPDEESAATQILRLLRERTRVDFSHYKATTLYRRMSRRMLLHSLDDLHAYLEFLRKQPDELQNLYRDILISVTSFFRDPKAFDALRDKVFPELLQQRGNDDPLRIWVLGCSTGEEAYSLAIALSEQMEDTGVHVPVQIFATDLNEQGIERARLGTYSREAADHVSAERLARWFSETAAGYRVCQAIREMCVFARQNVLADPPFSRMDLISCRNLLIYMEPVLQHRVLPLFHYALKPAGFLWLGSAETVGGFTDLFEARDARHRIYAKTPASTPALSDLQPGRGEWLGATRPVAPATAREDRAANLSLREADRVVSNRYGPPSVLVNQSLEILQFRGDTSPYLALAPGRPSTNLLKLAREGLVAGLRTALQSAIARAAPERQEGLEVKIHGRLRVVDVQVLPVPGGPPGERCFLVLFEDPANEGSPSTLPHHPVTSGQPEELQRANTRLARELEATREFMQSLVEDRDAVTEEMQSANEEIQSSNEELQSLNEELQTSKEEIQAANEELITVNDEMRGRNDELIVSNADLVNFLASSEIALVMLDRDLRIRRFTPAAESVMNLIPADIGRSINDLKLSFELPDLNRRLRAVIANGTPQEEEITDREGHRYLLRLKPYRTAQQAIDGAVILLIDIHARKILERSLHSSEEKSRLLMEGAVGIAIILIDTHGLVNGWNVGAERLFGYREPEIIGQHIQSFFTPEDVLAGRAEREMELSRKTGGTGDDNWLVRKDGERFWASGAMTALFEEDGTLRGFSKVVRDITERRVAETQLADVARRKDVFLATLSHELRNPLAPMRNALAIMKESEDDPQRSNAARSILERQLNFMVRLIDDLMDVSRISEGKVNLRRERTDLGETIRSAVEIARPAIDAMGHRLTVKPPSPPIRLHVDASRLAQVFANLLNNAAKYTPRGGHIAIAAIREGDFAAISVKDDGIGIAPESRAHIFEMFTQADALPGAMRDGLGVGLSLVNALIGLHGGSVEVRSEGKDHGSEFVVRLPISISAAALESHSKATVAPKRVQRRVLLVDDNGDSVDTMATLLNLLGYITQVARNAQEALDAMPGFAPDVIVLDIGLPDQNGYAVCQQIRLMPQGRDARIIALTGWGRPEDKQEALDAGFDAHLTKPVDVAVLERLFEKA
jgi:two-component system CheB/CheR fusion protein